MDIKEYINSGILELYVAGALSEEENREVTEAINKYPKIKNEVEAIEASILQLTAAASPKIRKTNFESVKEKFNITENKTLNPLESKKSKDEAKDQVKPEDQVKEENQVKPEDQANTEDQVKPEDQKKKKSKTKVKKPLDVKKLTSILPYIGWAAAVLFGLGLFWMVRQNSDLQEQYDSQVNAVSVQNMILEERAIDAEEALQKNMEDLAAKELEYEEKLKQVVTENTGNFKALEVFTAMRNEKVSTITLTGQKASPRSYAKIYWNKEEQKLYLDVKELPDPPEGKVYQLWSLKLEPLRPTSLGTLDGYADNLEKIFIIQNGNANSATEGFAITLEPEGGSEEPTLDKLYVLGVINT